MLVFKQLYSLVAAIFFLERAFFPLYSVEIVSRFCEEKWQPMLKKETITIHNFEYETPHAIWSQCCKTFYARNLFQDSF